MNKNKVSIYSGFAGLFGYFLASIVSQLFTDDPVLRGVIAILTVLIVGAFTYLYLKRNYPEEIKKEEVLEKDERGQLIRGKISTYTLIFIAVLEGLLFTYTYLKNQMLLSYLIAGSYALTAIFNLVVNSYLNKKL